MATFKQMTDFFSQIGAADVQHTSKGYLPHAIGVYNDLKKWDCEEDIVLAGLFHSIYGTERFQGFTLSTERRDEVVELIGERAERLAWMNCFIDRTHFDQEIDKDTGPYQIRDRATDTLIDVTDEDFEALCAIHLCDWLEQVPRSQDWGCRRAAYRRLADRLGGIALESYDRVFTLEPTAS